MNDHTRQWERQRRHMKAVMDANTDMERLEYRHADAVKRILRHHRIRTIIVWSIFPVAALGTLVWKLLQ